MKISSRVDYAICCVLRLMELGRSDEPVSVARIAAKEKLEPDYAEQLLIAMKRAGILKSVRGKKGGYILADAPEKFSAKDIVRAIENEVLELVCQRKKRRRKECVYQGDCHIIDFWIDVKQSFESVLDKYTLDKLYEFRNK